jgi:Arc/MetJ-type ribon-helix-helix transcriptional regulator
MTVLSDEVADLLRREMASGAYQSEEEVLKVALQLVAQRRETIASIQEGLDDISAGRTVAFEDFDREFRAKHGIGNRR